MRKVILLLVLQIINYVFWGIFGYGCKNPDRELFFTISLAMNLTVVIIGVYASWKTRKIPDMYNESKWIAFAVYSDFFTATLVIPILELVGRNRAAQLVLSTVGFIFAITCTTSFIFLPKALMVMEGVKGSAASKMGGALAGKSKKVSEVPKDVEMSANTTQEGGSQYSSEGGGGAMVDGKEYPPKL